MTSNKLSYKDSGVDIDAGNQLVENIKPYVKQTIRPEVKSNLGGFGALCSLPSKYKNPLLVSSTDGVGTKLRLALNLKKHETIGIDLVAMCVNDLIVQGAEPLFFLDYYATAKLDVAVATQVIKGIAEGCLQAGCALVGGETAEMPGMYHQGDYDIAGFSVGVVEKDDVIEGQNVRAGNKIIALASSGPHSNGYSLIRKVLEKSQADLNQPFEGLTLGDCLLTPTKIYVKSILATIEQHPIHAICHITGGGFWENIPRILPNPNLKAVLHQNTWEMPAIFHWLQREGNIDLYEMRRTFNCGIGMIVIVDANQADAVLKTLQQQGETAWIVGNIEHRAENDATVEIID